MQANIGSLPEALLFDILVRLPADFLHESAKLVCHKWHKIIRSDDFINTQIRHSSYGFLLSSENHIHPIYVTTTQGRIETSELSYGCKTEIYGCCNGMALELHQNQANGKPSLHLVNLATKQLMFVPEFSRSKRNFYPHHCGIAYSAASTKYKVILPYLYLSFIAHRLCLGLGVCTVGVDKSWREVEISHLPRDYSWLILRQFPLTTEGFTHWSRWSCVLTLNVETEVFTMSKVPIPPDHDNYYLSTGRYLNVFIPRGNFSWEFWEMNPPESGEWRKMVKIEMEPQKFDFVPKSYPTLKPLRWIKYPEILAFCFLRNIRICVLYNLDTHEISTVEFLTHVQILVFLRIGIT